MCLPVPVAVKVLSEKLISCCTARYAGVHKVQWHSEGIPAFAKDELCEVKIFFRVERPDFI